MTRAQAVDHLIQVSRVHVAKRLAWWTDIRDALAILDESEPDLPPLWTERFDTEATDPPPEQLIQTQDPPQDPSGSPFMARANFEGWHGVWGTVEREQKEP